MKGREAVEGLEQAHANKRNLVLLAYDVGRQAVQQHHVWVQAEGNLML